MAVKMVVDAKQTDERYLHARRMAQKRYRLKNREILNKKARERASLARSKFSQLLPEEQTAKHAAKLSAARRYRERNRLELCQKARFRRLNKFIEMHGVGQLHKFRRRQRCSLSKYEEFQGPSS
ncbi:hypothetical protein H0H92_015988 [Tricholoma furcatifolium]|nr:hypothetical protein H0H92_015988 [Tricholoma furcatifolium]